MAVARTGQTATLLPDGKVLVAGGGTASAELYDPQTGTWTPTGTLSVARTHHTATLLADGTVLVAGGCCNKYGTGYDSTEIYHPQSGTWTAGPRMTSGRTGHSATLLADGRVLLAGGACQTGCTTNSFFNTLYTAELYDPATDTFTATASMTTGREFHTATLLADGRVLVTGGFYGCDDAMCTDNADAEIYNPATGTWSAAGKMEISREQHTATLLPDGRVLVAGGLHDIPLGGATARKVLSSAELYDPATGTWTAAASMVDKHAGHTATLLNDGQVLIAGGLTSTTELYQPQRGIWVTPGGMNTVRLHGTATLLPNGTVLVAGGSAGRQALSSAELFTPGPGPLVYLTPSSLSFPSQLIGTSGDSQSITVLNAGSGDLSVTSVGVTGANFSDFPNTTTCLAAPIPPGQSCTVAVRFTPTGLGARSALVNVIDNAPLSPHTAPVSGYGAGPNAWSPTGSLHVGRALQAGALLQDGRVLVAGGQPTNNPLAFLRSAELYDPASATWLPTGSLNTARDYATATLLPDGEVLVAGGDGTTYIPLASAELYNPATGVWTPTGSMHNARFEHTATLLPSGKVLVAGGDVGKDAELYDPATGTWTLTGSMAASRSAATATLLPSGKVLVAGGDTSGTGAELYDPATGTWTATGALNVGRSRHTATLLPTGQVLVAGGYQGSCCNQTTISAELYDPRTGTWTRTGSLNVGRAEHTATLLSTGQVLVAGGTTCTPNCTTTSTAEMYDPMAGTWTLTGAMNFARNSDVAALLANGTVLVAGGDTTSEGGNTSELYRPALLAVTPLSGTVGQQIMLSGSGFDGHEAIQMYWDNTSTPLVSATADATGAFTATARVPTSKVGRHLLIAVGQRSKAAARTSFRVIP